jgi:hypothetical protein
LKERGEEVMAFTMDDIPYPRYQAMMVLVAPVVSMKLNDMNDHLISWLIPMDQSFVIEIMTIMPHDHVQLPDELLTYSNIHHLYQLDISGLFSQTPNWNPKLTLYLYTNNNNMTHTESPKIMWVTFMIQQSIRYLDICLC